MDQLVHLSREHNIITKLTTALFYALAVAIALNFFWHPGGIYASGITGFAQVVQTISERFLPFVLPTSLMLVVLNIPMFLLGWFKIGHRFTLYTMITVVLASIMMNVIPPLTMKFDPILCALFGGLVNGIGTGMALKSGMSTGGLDIIGIILREKTGQSFGSINIAVNLIIVVLAGATFGWIHAMYTAISIFINGRVIDMIYTKHQKMQVIIVTTKPQEIIYDIQGHMRRGITILHDAEGAFGHSEKTVLITIIGRDEMYDIETIIRRNDPYAFASITESVKILGRFKEAEIE